MTATTAPRLATPVKGGGFPGALAFEWTKFWSVRTTWWNLVIGLILSVGFAAIVGMSADASAQKGVDVAQPAPHAAAQGIMISQLTVVVLATLALTSEYAGGSIRSTLQSVPVRGRMLLAKTLVVMVVVAVAGTVFSLLSTLATAAFMGEHGAYTGGEMAATAFGVGGYLAMLAVLAVGTGTMLRSAAGTITAIIMLLLALPQLMTVVGAKWPATASDYMPSVAGNVLMTQDTDPYGAGTAALVLALWAFAGIMGGHVVLRRRDA